MERIKIVVPGAPVAKGRPRFRKVGKFVQAYTPAKTRNAELNILNCFKEQVKDFKMPSKGPISLCITFFMPVPVSLSKNKREALKGTWHLVKPDADNLAKAVCDALNGYAWQDDSAIWSLKVAKVYATDEPCTEVEIEYL